MAAPILWASRISVFFLQENLHVHKIPRFRGGKCRFYFYGRGDFSGVCKFSVPYPWNKNLPFMGRKQNMWKKDMWRLTEHTFVHTVKLPASTVVGVFVGGGAFTQKPSTLCGHFHGHLRVHSRVHFREHFRERVRGSNFAVRVLCAFLILAKFANFWPTSSQVSRCKAKFSRFFANF